MGNQFMAHFIGMIHLRHIFAKLFFIRIQKLECLVTINQSNLIFCSNPSDLTGMFLQLVFRVSIIHALIRRGGQ